MDRMVTSGSFDISKRTVSLLEKIPRLNDLSAKLVSQPSLTAKFAMLSVFLPAFSGLLRTWARAKRLCE